MAVTRGRPVERSRQIGWRAAFLAASVWSCLAPEPSLAAAAAMPANSPAQQTSGTWVADGGVSSGGGGNRSWRGGSGVSFAGAAGGDPQAPDRVVSGREVRAAGGKAAPGAATASAVVAPPEGRRERIRSVGFSASTGIVTRSRERPAPERVGGVGEDAKDGGLWTGGEDELMPLPPRGSEGEGRRQGGVRERRAQSEVGEGGAERGGEEEQEEEETSAAEDGLYGDEEDGVGSAGLMALVVCFGLLFCVMEVAKCYFLLECRRRRRWHRWRRQRPQNSSSAPQIPIASSRVVATDVPFAGSKDGWVEIVIDGVAMRNSLPGDKDMPSAPGYAVAGASHALQEAIEHARRLSPHRSYSATIFPPRAATPERAETTSPEMASTDIPSEMLPSRSDSPRPPPTSIGVTPSSPVRV